MPDDGNGTFVREYSWQTDANLGVDIEPERMDAEDDGFAAGLTNRICRDGQSTVIANIPFNGFRLLGVGTPTLINDAANKGYVDKIRAELSCVAVSAGTATAMTLTSSTVYAALEDGIVVGCEAGTTCTGAATTLDADGLGAKAVRVFVGGAEADPSANMIAAGGKYLFAYSEAAASAAGAWILLNPSPASDVTSKVTGPSSATADNFMMYDGTTGKLAKDSGYGPATATHFRANTADKVLVTDDVWSAADYVTLTDGVTIPVDMSLGFNFTVTLQGNRTLSNPTNTKNGQKGTIIVKQDGTGSRTLAFDTNYEWAGGTAMVMSTAAGAKDRISYEVESSTSILLSNAGKAFS